MTTMFRTGLRSRHALFAAFALAGLAGTAQAEPQIDIHGARTDTRAQTVSVSDLNLSSAAGQHRAERRIAYAARQVCGYSPTFGLRQPKDYLRCQAAAVNGAQAQLQPLMAGASRSAAISVRATY